MPPAIPPFEQLSLADNFLFTEVMRSASLSQLFLESLLGKKIARVQYITKEQDLSDTYACHGIRLDIYLADERNTRYCIEMQQAPQRALPRRIRFYQGGIDRDFLDRGASYDALPESYIIFLCNYDPFHAGFACYERQFSLKGIPSLTYQDGSHVFILNTHYSPNKANVPKSIQEYLDYVRENDGASPFHTKLGLATLAQVQNVKNDNKIRSKYMQTEAYIYDKVKEGEAIGRKEGRKEGRQQGRKEGQKSIIKTLAKKLSPEQISEMLEMPLDTVNKLLAA